MLPGEAIAGGAPDTCANCGTNLTNEVLCSRAGYYIGTQCECGPYSRESGYYRTYEVAQSALNSGPFSRT
ncbi:MAG: hypothetical protein WCE63_24195 [Acidobacteriaceae bacterium]